MGGPHPFAGFRNGFVGQPNHIERRQAGRDLDLDVDRTGFDPLKSYRRYALNHDCPHLLKNIPRTQGNNKNNCRTKRIVLILISEGRVQRPRKGDGMVDLQTVEIELQNARQARINAELACSDIEELAEEIRQSHHAFMRLLSERRSFRLH